MKRACGALIGCALAGIADGAYLRSANSKSDMVLATDTEAEMDSSATGRTMVSDMIEKGSPITGVLKHPQFLKFSQDALEKVQSKLPAAVTSLLHANKTTSGTEPEFTEESKTKARKILNKMIEDYMANLDDVIIECKAKQNLFRVNLGQVYADLWRIGAELAEAEEKITDNYNCIQEQDAEYKAVDGLLSDETAAYERQRAADEAELTLRKNDLAVWSEIMKIVKCPAGTTEFIQENATVKFCQTSSGPKIVFSDESLSAQVSKSPRLQSAIGELVANALMTTDDLSLVQVQSVETAADTTTFGVTTTRMDLAVTQSPTPVQEEPPPSVNLGAACKAAPKPHCGKLTDTMSLQWGKFKDLVDELQSEMDKNEDAWTTRKAELNDQMTLISGQKAECQTNFDAATGRKNTLNSESTEKTEIKQSLEVEYAGFMEECHNTITEMLFTDICGTYAARNTILKDPTIADCEVSDWVLGDCSVDCDDECPKRVGGKVDPYKCGGKQVLTRTIIVNVNEKGVKCPALSKETRCSQFKCPIQCQMSAWSGWSACTKECGGGARQRTRSILTRPNHGGKICDSPTDAEPCNTGSCDRNCKLDDWTDWSPCSMACDPSGMPGFQTRVKKVIVPTRGFGVCPDEKSEARFEERTCNEQACIGDEICVAKQDLVIMLDQSGSLKGAGSKVLRKFAANLTGNYMSEYYGIETVKIGVVVFGNGEEVTVNGVTSIKPAIYAMGLTSDLAAVKAAIDDDNSATIKYQGGFTNMAQGFIEADRMLSLDGRPDAMSAVLVISDGKYSFAFNTEKAVNELKEKGTYIFMAPVAEREGLWSKKLKEWATQPWETNYQLLPGLLDVEFNMKIFSAALIAKFCPEAISPTLEAARDDRRGYLLVHEEGLPKDSCGQWKDVGIVESLDECARKTVELFSYQMFSITEPSQWYDGKRHCYAEAIPVTVEDWHNWLNDRIDIKCGGQPDGFFHTPMYDVYAIKPVGA